MSERFEIRTIKRSKWRGLADFYETTMYDPQTDTTVTCAGDTPSDSRTNAKAYLDVLSDRKDSH